MAMKINALIEHRCCCVYLHPILRIWGAGNHPSGGIQEYKMAIVVNNHHPKYGTLEKMGWRTRTWLSRQSDLGTMINGQMGA